MSFSLVFKYIKSNPCVDPRLPPQLTFARFCVNVEWQQVFRDTHRHRHTDAPCAPPASWLGYIHPDGTWEAHPAGWWQKHGHCCFLSAQTLERRASFWFQPWRDTWKKTAGRPAVERTSATCSAPISHQSACACEVFATAVVLKRRK